MSHYVSSLQIAQPWLSSVCANTNRPCSTYICISNGIFALVPHERRSESFLYVSRTLLPVDTYCASCDALLVTCVRDVDVNVACEYVANIQRRVCVFSFARVNPVIADSL